MSAYLKYGCIHPRTMHAALGTDEGRLSYGGELVWRDFYADVLWHRPDTAREDLNPQLAGLQYDEGPEADRRFERWATGTTGYPIVDAGMRQLLGEAWMHNRVRMIVGSFLTKDLHLHWRRGAGTSCSTCATATWPATSTAGSGSPAPARTPRRTSGSSTRSSRAATTTRRRVHPPLGAGAARGARQGRARAVDAAGRPAERLPAPVVDHDAERKEALRRYSEVKG
jgi:deoxyribodipyrimidine photo-lyase